MKESQPSTLVPRPHKGKSARSALQGIVGLVETPVGGWVLCTQQRGDPCMQKLCWGECGLSKRWCLENDAFRPGISVCRKTWQQYWKQLELNGAYDWLNKNVSWRGLSFYKKNRRAESWLCQETALEGRPELQLPALWFHNQGGKVRLFLLSKFILWRFSGCFLFWVPFLHVCINTYPKELWGTSV